MYAILHKETNRFVYRAKNGGVDLSYDKAITFLDKSSALYFMVQHHIHKNLFKPVKVSISISEERMPRW